MGPKPDFSGYVTKYGVKCSDGRTILAHAFKDSDGTQIPLVYQHQHSDINNVLGHLVLAHKNDGVWADGYFNDTPSGKSAKQLVIHKDLKALSIFANGLVQQGSSVTHGNIREGSLVMAGANPGAFIQDVYVQHASGNQQVDDEAIIFSGDEIQHGDTNSGPGTKIVGTPKPPLESLVHSGGEDPRKTVQDVVESFDDVQTQVVHYLLTDALEHGNNSQEGSEVTRNVFENTGGGANTSGTVLTHDAMQSIFEDAKKSGSLKSAVTDYALAHGIDNIDQLFPFEQDVQGTPEWISRRMEWVAGVLGGVHKTPFSRIRSRTADITEDDARAKGYIKGSLKKEQFFKVARRVTTPQTIYKKQKLDRDDILDITEFDVVVWLQAEMRVMLDEELARAILIGDGRAVDDSDKIDPDHIRPILDDDELYVSKLFVDLSDASSTIDELVDSVVMGMRFYRGTGTPTMYTTLVYLSKLLLAKDTLGRRLYMSKSELASALGVSAIIPCEAMEGALDAAGNPVAAIIVNLSDYTVGADKGGQVSMFDFFDIDFNQYKYLIETRVSGAMTKFKGALVLLEFTGAGGMLPYPTAPTFNKTTGVGTIPTTSHVTYVTVATDGTESSALTAGAQTAVALGASVHYRAKPASTYAFADDENQDWTFTRVSS